MIITVLADEYAPGSEAMVALTLRAFKTRTAERWLDAKLDEVRRNPEAALVWMEEALLRALSGLGECSPEHVKQTGRRAGGGKLRKGS